MARANPRNMGNTSPIATARLAAGLTQARLAEAVGCSEHAINRWERDLFQPSGKNLLKLAEALGRDPKELL